MDDYHITKRNHFDLALLRLKRPVEEFTDAKMPICLPTDSK